MPDAPRSPDHVQSLSRGLSVIRAFDAERPELTLTEVARRADLTRAAARRFLLTLVDLGYVRAVEGRFALRPRVLELGFAYLSGLGLPDIAQPHMEELSAAVGESCSASVLDDLDVVYVVRVPTRRIMTVAIAVGTRFPAFATSMGRVLLAALPEAELAERLSRLEARPLTERTTTDAAGLREILDRAASDGHALVDQELEHGLRSVAVPLHGPGGRVVAALNVSAHTSRATLKHLRGDVLPHLRATGEAIDADLLRGGIRT